MAEAPSPSLDSTQLHWLPRPCLPARLASGWKETRMGFKPRRGAWENLKTFMEWKSQSKFDTNPIIYKRKD